MMDTRGLSVEDLSICREIFDASFYPLHRQHGLEEEEASEPDWLRPILTHFLETDPEGGRIASENGEPVGFASTVRRASYWFLSFLFVLPEARGQGVGRRLVSELVPNGGDVVRATVVESFQPVSTGLYASFGITPRAIKYWLSGVTKPDGLPSLTPDLGKTEMVETDLDDVAALDRRLLGFGRVADHAWWREAGTPSWVYRRGGDLAAYAYVDGGFVGPVLAVDEETLCSVVADRIRDADDPSACSVNISGSSRLVFRMLVDAGARIDDAKYRYIYCSSSDALPPSYIHHSDWLP